MTHIAMQAWNILRNKMNQSNQINHSLFRLKNLVLPERMCSNAIDWKIGREKKEAQSLSLAVATLTHNAGYTVLRNKMNECNQS